jgi:hypothetical protein
MTTKIPEEDGNEYLSAVLKLYLDLPETPSRAGLHDRKSAVALHARGIKLVTVESALLLASLRRLGRPPNMPPLSPIHSLAYFLPVIQELLDTPVSDDYRDYLRMKVRLLDNRRPVTKHPQLCSQA